MHDLRGSNHLSAEYLTEALQSKAYPEHGFDPAERLDEGIAQPGIGWAPWSGTDEHAVGIKVECLIEGYRVVAIDHRLSSQLAQVLNQVVDERVVVVDYQDSGTHRCQRYRGSLTTSER